MVNLRKVLVILFVVLPVIIAGCQVSVSQRKTNSGSKYNTYTAVITNTGKNAASNVVLSTSTSLHSVTGMTESDEDKYELPSGQTIAGGASYSFTYQVKSGDSVSWSTSCSSAASASASATAAPKATTAPITSSKATTAAKATAAPTTASKATTAAKATTAPTTASKATTAPKATTPASGAATGRKCSSGSVWRPSPLTTYQWQLTGTIDTSIDVQMYDIDLFDNSENNVISTLHADGRVVICYFSTQYENWRPDASSFTSAVIGSAMDGWAGENWVDIRSSVVRNIITERLALAASIGCDGVEPDNVDGYENDSGFPVTAADQLNFNEFIAASAHAVGLSVGLKNDADQAAQLEPYFDWVLNEQCYQYSECNTLTSFITAGKAVFNTEYKGSAATVCPYMNSIKFSSLLKPLSLTATINAQCCTYGSCAAAAYTCAAPSNSLLADSAPMLETVAAPQFTHEASAATTTAASMIAIAAALVALNL